MPERTSAQAFLNSLRLLPVLTILLLILITQLSTKPISGLSLEEFHLSSRDARPVQLDLSDGKPCEIALDIYDLDPSEVSFQLQALPDSALDDWTVHVVLPGLEISPESSVSDASLRASTFRLEIGSYMLVVTREPRYKPSLLDSPQPCNSNPKSGATHVFSLSRYVVLTPPELRPEQGASAAFRLNPVLQRTQFSFTLSRRSRVSLRVTAAGWPREGHGAIGVRVRTTINPRRRVEAQYVEGITDVKARDRSFFFVLTPGVYRIEVGTLRGLYAQAAAPLPEQMAKSNLTIHVASIRDEPIPAELLALSNWLTSIDAGKDIEIVDLYRRGGRNSKLSLPEQRYYEQLLFDVALTQQSVWKHRVPPFIEDDLPSFIQPSFEDASMQWPDWIDQAHIPEYLLVLRTNGTRERLKAIEEAHRERSNSFFWDRALRKVALATDVATRRVVAFMEVFCGAHLIYEVQPGEAERGGPECQMATARQNITLGPASVAGPGTARLRRTLVLGDRIGAFFGSFLPKDALLQYLDQQDNTVEVIVRNIRGHVIPGGRDWEKVNINIVLLRESDRNAQLNVYIDGSISSGIGKYPRDAQFTKSMEPEYSQDLTNYAKALASALSAYLEKGKL